MLRIALYVCPQTICSSLSMAQDAFALANRLAAAPCFRLQRFSLDARPVQLEFAQIQVDGGLELAEQADLLIVPATGSAVGLTFVPHLTPMIRGIHSTLYPRLSGFSGTLEDLQALFEQRYADEPFVDVMPAGSHPETRSVRGANVCRIAVHRPQGGDTVVVLSVIDNLTKGASGQAVQNMNILFGLDERAGLAQPALMP